MYCSMAVGSDSLPLPDLRVIFIFVGFMGYFFYNEIPNSSVITGGLLITVGGIYIAFKENKFEINSKIR